MSNRMLPEKFEDLEPFASAWASPTSAERYGKRLSSAMEEIKAFYDAIVPRMGEIIEYLNQFPLDSMPEDAKRLSYLTLSLAEISPAVELFGQPDVVDGFEPSRLVAVPVPHMTPPER